MDFYEAVDSRRAVRAFSSRPVPRTVLVRVLEAATRAPSAAAATGLRAGSLRDLSPPVGQLESVTNQDALGRL